MAHRLVHRVGFQKRSSTPLTIARPDSLEASLFLRIATARPADADWVASVGESRRLDWDRLTAFALRENAVTLLDDRVSRVPESLLPAEQRDRIGRLALIWTFKLKLLERRLQESLRVLSRAGIEVILLKGAALAATTYRSFTERPMADIDLLIDPARASEAHELMQRNGWILVSSGHPSDAWDDHHHLPPLCDTNGSGLKLEIHVAPIPPGHPFKLDFAYVTSTSQRLALGEVQVRVPENHVHAVHAAIHFAWSHRFESGGMNAFRDLAALEASGKFSWTRFVEIARQVRAEACCYWTVRLAQSLGGLAVSEGGAKRARSSDQRALPFAARRALLANRASLQACVPFCHASAPTVGIRAPDQFVGEGGVAAVGRRRSREGSAPGAPAPARGITCPAHARVVALHHQPVGVAAR